MDKIQQLADYIDRSSCIVATTGAGISVGGGGITYGQMVFKNRGSMRRSGSGSGSFLPTYLDNMFSYQPSFAHYALAKLEAEGKLAGIITTNVDCMHTIAGSKNVAEIQGSLQVNCCSGCGRHYDGYEIWKQEELPKCGSCGGEILPWPLYSHISVWDPDVRKAQEWIAKADLILVIGTRGNYGNVYWDYRSRDAVIVQINPGHTSFDHVADLNIREACDDVFHKLTERGTKMERQQINNELSDEERMKQMAAQMRAAEYKGLSEDEIQEREMQKEMRREKNIEVLEDTLDILKKGSYKKGN